MNKTVSALWTLILLAAVACSRQEESSWTSSVVGFSAEVLSTRTAFSPAGDGRIAAVWSPGDTIGIWCSNSPRGNYPYEAEIERSDVSKASFGAVSEDRMFLYDGKPATYYAYYPYRPSNGDTPIIKFQLPSVQSQSASGDLSGLPALQPFRAAPVQVSGNDAQVNFAFTPVLSTVHLALRMNDGESVNVPVRMLKLLSDASPLSSQEVSLDLTASDSVPAATGGSDEVTLTFSTLPVLVSGSDSDAYLTVLPGSHSGGLSCEITAIDGSVATVTLPAVNFGSGNSYSRSVSLALSDFVQADPFDITASSLTVKAGEPVTFSMNGSAAKIDFWSGEKFHDYEYSQKDRFEYGDIYMSFLQALLSGGQGDCLKVKISTDYDGTLDEDSILAATWTDITGEFNLDTSISGSGNPTAASNYGKFKKSADVAVSDFAGGKSFRLALFWSALPDLGGRTVSWITGLKVWDADGVLMNQEDNAFVSGKAITEYNPVLIEGDSYGSDTNHCSWYAINGCATSVCFRFFSTFTLTGTAERHAYAVIDNNFTPKQTNLGHDAPVQVQSESDPTPASWNYTFKEPGTYKAVFEASCPTLSGDKTELREFTITVQ